MIFAFENFGPEQILARLQHERRKGIEFLLPACVPQPSARHVIVFDFNDFIHNAALFRAARYRVYVFAHPQELARWGLKPIDVGYESILDVDFESGQRNASRPKFESIGQRVLQKVQARSVFGDLMSAIYDLPSKSGQSPATSAVCKWLTTDEPLSALDPVIRTIVKRKVDVHTRMMEILARPITERLRGALKAVAEGAAHDVAAEEFNVPEYEISYVIGNLSRKKNILDTHVANVGED